jgi:hypothetical protein
METIEYIYRLEIERTDLGIKDLEDNETWARVSWWKPHGRHCSSWEVKVLGSSSGWEKGHIFSKL